MIDIGIAWRIVFSRPMRIMDAAGALRSACRPALETVAAILLFEAQRLRVDPE
jgi:hypothetical protein